MLLTAANDIPLGKEWVYETKYDGFRCILEWGDELILTSRNGKILNQVFPEIVNFCQERYEKIKHLLPLTLDGELVYLTNNVKSDFSVVQSRGRMRKEDVVKKHAQDFPCHYVAFDLLVSKGESQTSNPLTYRKQELKKLFQLVHLPTLINYEDIQRLQLIEVFDDSELLWKKIIIHNGEGIIAKRKMSNWNNDKRTSNWVKIKYWRYVSVILLRYNASNNYFHGAVYNKEQLVEVVTFRHGLTDEQIHTLIMLFQTNGTKEAKNIWEIEPSICVEIACIDFDGNSLREPRFHRFELEKNPDDCQWMQMQRQLIPLPTNIHVTSLEKTIWRANNIQKDNYLYYLQQASSYIIPFLRDRLLTVIRYPHGVTSESFYQKNWPDNLPDFIVTKQVEDIRYVTCNNVESLLWLGNQLALEFHIPFQTIQTDKPTEIVFDLDPPSVDEFSLAVEAALRMKEIFDHFELSSFVKTSGGKGLQIYIPLPIDTYSYEETRVFTKFVCDFLCEQEPQWFTTERLKKNRNFKLYLDYVQHQEGKTIIAPYSTRGNERGLVATPLYWEEVGESLNPRLFPIPAVLDRIKEKGNPFRLFRQETNNQQFATVLFQLKDLLK